MTFERKVAVKYLAHLLVGNGTTELGDERRVQSVAFQQAPTHAVDDLVVTAGRADEGEPSLVLAISVRRAPNLVNSDEATRKLICNFVRDLINTVANRAEHRFALVVAGQQAQAAQLAVLADEAISQMNAGEFFDLVRTPGKFASDVLGRLDQLEGLVTRALVDIGVSAPETAVVQQRTWELLSRLTVLMPRLEAPDEADWATVVNWLVSVARGRDLAGASRLRDRLVALTNDYAPKAATVNLTVLKRDAHTTLDSSVRHNQHGVASISRRRMGLRIAVGVAIFITLVAAGIYLKQLTMLRLPPLPVSRTEVLADNSLAERLARCAFDEYEQYRRINQNALTPFALRWKPSIPTSPAIPNQGRWWTTSFVGFCIQQAGVDGRELGDVDSLLAFTQEVVKATSKGGGWFRIYSATEVPVAPGDLLVTSRTSDVATFDAMIASGNPQAWIVVAITRNARGNIAVALRDGAANSLQQSLLELADDGTIREMNRSHVALFRRLRLSEITSGDLELVSLEGCSPKIHPDNSLLVGGREQGDVVHFRIGYGSDVEPLHKQALRVAMQMWNSHTHKTGFHFEDSSAGDADFKLERGLPLFLRNSDEMEKTTCASYSSYDSAIRYSPNLMQWLRDETDITSAAHIYAHELGHALNIGHVSRGPSLMTQGHLSELCEDLGRGLPRDIPDRDVRIARVCGHGVRAKARRLPLDH